MRIHLASPRGFCAGVSRAIEIVERALEMFGAPVYVRHEVVHNRYVVAGLRKKGAVFVEQLAEVPEDATVIFSAHGVPQSVREEARARGLRVFDATCPLVTKVHMEVVHYRKNDIECVLIGHQGHPEVEGTMGQVSDGIYLVQDERDVVDLAVKDPTRLAYVTQTTLAVDDTRRIIAALRARFPAIRAPRKDDICYATQNRQDAVKSLAQTCEVILVVGSPESSNSTRLTEVARAHGAHAYLIDSPEQIEDSWLSSAKNVGVTAGASAPEVLVEAVVDYLESKGGVTVRAQEPAAPESVVFALPRQLRSAG